MVAQSLVEKSVPFEALDRDVFCLLGIPVDVVSMDETVGRLLGADPSRSALISTPNLNFLVSSMSDPDFRDVLRMSDLCPVDGLALVWLGRLLRIPIRERVAGSDFFEALVARTDAATPLRVFLFGGDPGVARAAADRLGREGVGVTCVGYLDPGRGSVEELSRPDIIETINASGADFLVVALGAVKGQKWLARNHHLLTPPLRSHLGAVLNFRAGTVRRAPLSWRAHGFEWLWRIREEPRLWRRYAVDGLALLAILATRVAPLLLLDVAIRPGRTGLTLLSGSARDGVPTLALAGDARVGGLETVVEAARRQLRDARDLVIDMTQVRYVDARTIGLLMMIRKMLRTRAGDLRLCGLGFCLRLAMRLHGASDLVDRTVSADATAWATDLARG